MSLVFVSAVGDRLAGVVAQQPPIWGRTPLPRVVLKVDHERRGHRLPPLGVALLPQQDQALVRVQVGRAQGERPATPAGGLRVQPQQQGVQRRVVAGRGGDLVDLR
jgi:hypothetical protein